MPRKELSETSSESSDQESSDTTIYSELSTDTIHSLKSSVYDSSESDEEYRYYNDERLEEAGLHDNYLVSKSGHVKYVGDPETVNINGKKTIIRETYELKHSHLKTIVKDRRQYRTIMTLKGNNSYQIHQLIARCFLPKGKPDDQIDHINQKGFDNRTENLRYVSSGVNNQNKGEGKFYKQISKKCIQVKKYTSSQGITWYLDNVWVKPGDKDTLRVFLFDGLIYKERDGVKVKRGKKVYPGLRYWCSITKAKQGGKVKITKSKDTSIPKQWFLDNYGKK